MQCLHQTLERQNGSAAMSNWPRLLPALAATSICIHHGVQREVLRMFMHAHNAFASCPKCMSWKGSRQVCCQALIVGLLCVVPAGDANSCSLVSSNPSASSCQQVHATCLEDSNIFVAGLEPGRTNFGCYVFPGQSGSPVYQQVVGGAQGRETRYLVKGVIVAGPSGGGPGAFTVVSRVLYNNLIAWMTSTS